MGDIGPIDTIAALSSGRPPAGVAIVRTSGVHAFAAAERVAGPLPAPRHAALRRLVDPAGGDLIDEALVLRFDGPHSATGENVVEYQCHGGRATVDALLAILCREPGIRLAEPGEFTRRALANGRIDLTEAEGLADLLAAETEVQRRSAMMRAGGGLRQRLDGWRTLLLDLSARAEVAIDYADEADGSGDPALTADIAALETDMSTLIAAPRVEPLRDGIRVVVAGPPNAGKSSLVNALAEAERAIVTPVAGTTRDVIEVPVAIDGIPFVLVDTAGLRDSVDEVEAIGVARAERESSDADILLWLGDPTVTAAKGGVLVHAKCDIAPVVDNGLSIAVSSVTGEGLDRLKSVILARAADLLPRADELAIDRRQHHLLSEAALALHRAGTIVDPVLVAEELRTARHAIDRIGGHAGVEDLLDALFGRFCLGK